MRSFIMAAVAATSVFSLSSPVLADVKTGVDAWERGEFDSAVKQWRPLAIAGDADAQFNLAQAYRFGRAVPMDLKQAEDWYRRAAIQGHVQAEDNLGLIMFQNGDRPNAMPYIRRSADRGDARAQYVLGTALFNGDLLPKDWPLAYAYMIRSSSAGLDKASGHLAQMDKYISLQDRQRGLVLARAMEDRASRTQLALQDQSPSDPISTQPSRPAPQPYPTVRETDLAAQAGRPLQPGMGRSALPPPPRRQPPTPIEEAPMPPSSAPPMSEAPPPVMDLPDVAPIERTPEAEPMPIAPPRIAPAYAAGPTWRVQLGAFGQEANARGLWTSLKARSAKLHGLQPYLVKSGSLTRLQAGPLRSKTDAEGVCRAMRANGQSCLIVAP